MPRVGRGDMLLGLAEVDYVSADEAECRAAGWVSGVPEWGAFRIGYAKRQLYETTVRDTG